MARAMQVIGFAAVASADMGPSARRLRGYAVNSTSLASSSNLCSSFCCWSGGCSSCGTDWNQRMYAPGCQVECSGPNCGSGKAHQYYNTQDDWKSSCPTPVCGQDEEEASLLQHAPAGCEGLSRTVPSRCPAGVKGTSTGVEINTQLTCVYDPQCAEPGGDPAAKCYEQTTCAYKSTPAEASLLQHAPAGCEGLSRTVPSQCPAGVKGTSTGVEINTQLTCVYDPQCAEPGGDPAAKCYEQTTCAYKSTPAPAGCEGLSRTVPSQCPAGVKGTSTGVEINTQLKCVYDPQCAEPGGDPAAKCYEQTTCAYKS